MRGEKKERIFRSAAHKQIRLIMFIGFDENENENEKRRECLIKVDIY